MSYQDDIDALADAVAIEYQLEKKMDKLQRQNNLLMDALYHSICDAHKADNWDDLPCIQSPACLLYQEIRDIENE